MSARWRMNQHRIRTVQTTETILGEYGDPTMSLATLDCGHQLIREGRNLYHQGQRIRCPVCRFDNSPRKVGTY